MPTTFTTPSADFPGPPSISLVTPDDWSAGPAGPLALAVLAPDTGHAFRANVVVSTQRLAASTTLEELASGVRTRTADLEEVQTVLDQVTDLDGRPAHLLEYTYRDEGAGTLVQMVLTLQVPHDDVTDLVGVVGSLAGDRLDEDAQTVATVMQSLRTD